MSKLQSNRNSRNINIDGNMAIYLDRISVYVQKPKNEIINSIIKELYQTMEPHFSKANLSGEPLMFFSQFVVGPKVDLIFNTRQIDMKADDAELDKQLADIMEEKQNIQEAKNRANAEKNKKKFKKIGAQINAR